MKDIDELDRLHAAAWGGPWTAETWDVCLHDCETILAPEAYPDGQVVAQVSHADGRIVAPGLEQFAAANTAAIVALHNAWPSVSARLRAAEAEVERLRAALDNLAFAVHVEGGRPSKQLDKALDAARAALGET